MDNMFVLMDVLIAGYGFYMIYAYVLMKTKGEVKENMLLSAEVKMEKCKDKEAYILYIAPKLLLFGIGVAICGCLGMLNNYMGFLGNIYGVVPIISLALIIWFVVTVKKSVKLFW